MVKNLPVNARGIRDLGSIPGLGRSTGEENGNSLQYSWVLFVAPQGKNLPTIWETWVQSLGWEDPLEKGMATHSSITAWRIPWTEEPGGLQTREGHKKLDMTKQLTFSLYIPNLEKEMATHCSTLAWSIPWTEEPGGLQSTGSQRVGHD